MKSFAIPKFHTFLQILAHYGYESGLCSLQSIMIRLCATHAPSLTSCCSWTISKILGGRGAEVALDDVEKWPCWAAAPAGGGWWFFHLDRANLAENVRGVTARKMRTRTGDSLPSRSTRVTRSPASIEVAVWWKSSVKTKSWGRRSASPYWEL